MYCTSCPFTYEVPLRVRRADNEVTVFWIETNTVAKENYGTVPVKDFYVNGKRYPVTSNATEEGRKKNRRVAIRFLPHEEKIAGN